LFSQNPAIHCENMPESLDGRSVSEFVGQWWVGQPRGNQEESILKLMDVKGVQYYRPLHIEGYDTHHRLGKPAVRLPKYRPLFKGYLCFCGEMADRIWARDTNKFASFIEIRDQKRFVTQLSQVQSALKTNPQMAMEPIPAKGTRMRVKSGLLMGTEGRFNCTGKHGKFVITLDAMNQAAELEIDAAKLEPI
jgi:hypothetical protein